MEERDKLDRVCRNFSLLNEEKQEYILGILQGMVFAHEEAQAEAVQGPRFPQESARTVKRENE